MAGAASVPVIEAQKDLNDVKDAIKASDDAGAIELNAQAVANGSVVAPAPEGGAATAKKSGFAMFKSLKSKKAKATAPKDAAYTANAVVEQSSTVGTPDL